jgi:hypothetical protein
MDTQSPNPILLGMMKSGDSSDLKFLCNGHEFKAVVCPQSPMIKAATLGEHFTAAEDFADSKRRKQTHWRWTISNPRS